MGDYKRSTRECSFEQIQGDLLKAINAFSLERQLGDIAANALISCETVSELVKVGFLKRLMGIDDVTRTAVVVTPELLIWATRAGERPIVVAARRLSEIEVEDYSNSSFAKLMDDNGLQVNGFPLGGTERVLVFIGLGEGAAAQRLKDVLWEAVEKARS